MQAGGSKREDYRCWTTSRSLHWDIQAPGSWSKSLSYLQPTAPLGGNSRIQNQEGSSQLDVIQATGLINPNQAKSPGGILMKMQAIGFARSQF